MLNATGSGNSVGDSSGAFDGAERVRISSDLQRYLGPEYVLSRPSGGGRVTYVPGFHAIELANRIFGFNGWRLEIKETTVDFIDDPKGNGRWEVGILMVVRVTLKDGTFHEDIGYGNAENQRLRAQALEMAKKEALTDALKRALRCFGNALGNCLYDTKYTAKVDKMKKKVTPVVELELLRPTWVREQAAVAVAPAAVLTGGAPPRHLGTGKEQLAAAAGKEATKVVAAGTAAQEQQAASAAGKEQTVAVPPPFTDSFMFLDEFDGGDLDEYEMNLILNKGTKAEEAEDVAAAEGGEGVGAAATTEALKCTPDVEMSEAPAVTPAASFVSARSTTPFDPTFQSPSMRRTVDHSRSAPVRRDTAPSPNLKRNGHNNYPPPKRGAPPSPSA